MSVIELKNITKSFMDGMQKREILHDLNLTVNKGEFVAIVGPSGSGKSTFLSIAGLLLSSDSGEIRIADQNLTNVTQSEWTKKRLELLGFIFQDHQLLSYMTVGERDVIIYTQIKFLVGKNKELPLHEHLSEIRN